MSTLLDLAAAKQDPRRFLDVPADVSAFSAFDESLGPWSITGMVYPTERSVGQPEAVVAEQFGSEGERS